ncbi:hypothetical protein F2Q70_00039140 [Brassica cretica]|uniref:Dirigent protein n=1 Tax=Brassica cretica TaxID=69181 RepID=A0A8S9KCW4_BRACR|nr:hypothetical protein F2Q70_00039140 [Brassica cretica]
MVVARTLFSVSAILIIIITLFVHVNAVQETGELKTESSRNTLLADYESHEHAVKDPEGIAAMVDIFHYISPPPPLSIDFVIPSLPQPSDLLLLSRVFLASIGDGDIDKTREWRRLRRRRSIVLFRDKLLLMAAEDYD